MQEQVGPKLAEDCRWEASHVGKTKSSQRYVMVCQGKKVVGSSLQTHTWLPRSKQKLRSLLKANLPTVAGKDFALTTHGQKHDWLSLEDLGFSDDDWLPHKIVHREAQWLDQGGELHPIWTLTLDDQETGAARRLVWIDARHGNVLRNSKLGFHVSVTGDVFGENHAKTDLQQQALAFLQDPFAGKLDGTYFSVLDGSPYQERAEAHGGHFHYSPTREATLFDQVQTYFNVSKAWRWFTEVLHFTPNLGRLTVRTHMLIDGYDTDNAKYEPASGPLTAELQFGSGSSNIQNLSRDPDVAYHELSHHFIYHFIDDNRGTAGILHEGFADYFTYAMSNNGDLGETLIPDQPFLRTAELDQTYRYDNPNISRRPHKMGQVWAATLWDMRRDLGAAFDHTVFRMLTMLDANSGFKEVFDSLLAADSMENGAESFSLEHAADSPHYCAILNVATKRGFAYFLPHLDGSSCGLDLQDLALQSQANLRNPEVDAPADDGPRIFGKPCAVFPGQTPSHPFIPWLLFVLPLLISLLTRRHMTKKAALF